MEKNWKILDVKSDAKTGLVVQAKYMFSIKDQKGKVLKIGTCDFSGNTKSKSFVDFEKLTEEQVIEWVKKSLGNKVASIEKLANDEFKLLNSKMKENSKFKVGSLPKPKQEETEVKKPAKRVS